MHLAVFPIQIAKTTHWCPYEGGGEVEKEGQPVQTFKGHGYCHSPKNQYVLLQSGICQVYLLHVLHLYVLFLTRIFTGIPSTVMCLNV